MAAATMTPAPPAAVPDTELGHGRRDSTEANICFLADIPRYHEEKPAVFVPPAKPHEIEGINPPNVKRDYHADIQVEDVRPFKDELDLERFGFEVLSHESKHTALDEVEVCDAYRAENEELLKSHLKAERVITWGLKKRMPKERAANETWDTRNPVEIEQPAVMAHCDFTYDRGLVMVESFLGQEQLQKYKDEGYRVRIINTWRPLVPIVERQPLAICDKNTVNPDNLVACDRVLVDDVGEIYLLQHRPEQKWYWLESQTPAEPFIFTTWDSSTPGEANHSPHVSFDGHDVRPDAPPRFSVETRSIVVDKIRSA